MSIPVSGTTSRETQPFPEHPNPGKSSVALECPSLGCPPWLFLDSPSALRFHPEGRMLKHNVTCTGSTGSTGQPGSPAGAQAAHRALWPSLLVPTVPFAREAGPESFGDVGAHPRPSPALSNCCHGYFIGVLLIKEMLNCLLQELHRNN